MSKATFLSTCYIIIRTSDYYYSLGQFHEFQGRGVETLWRWPLSYTSWDFGYGFRCCSWFCVWISAADVGRALKDHLVQLFHVTYEETEAWPDEGICLRSHSQLVGKPEVEPALLTSNEVYFFIPSYFLDTSNSWGVSTGDSSFYYKQTITICNIQYQNLLRSLTQKLTLWSAVYVIPKKYWLN